MTKVRLTVSILLLLISTFAIAQQSTTGVITGVVTEQSGAVVPGANIEARNTDTNYLRSAKSDAGGRFTFTALPPGPYKVLVSGVKGFATVQDNVVLTIGQTVTLNIPMRVAAVQEQVVVNTEATIDLVKTESSTTINNEAVSTIPVLGRKFEDLLTLTPGVSISQGPDGDEINFAGQRGIFNNISIDGGDYNNGFFGEQMGGQRAAVDITLDAIGEFQVVATGANAEFGRTAGGVVNVVTKSGTNDLHGSAFEFFRHENLTSDTSDGKPLDGFKRNQFGGTIGGPIKKDKLFFFGAVEHIRENLNRANLGQQVGPTACPSSFVPTLDGGTNENLINTNVDCQRIALLNYFQSNFGDNEGKPVVHTVRNTAVLGKVDWNINGNNKLSTSYNFDRSDNQNQTFDVATYGTSANGEEGPSKINAINLNEYATLSQSLVNEAHFGFSRENRPREATNSKIVSDIAMGSGINGDDTTFRFGHPFFLQPNVDEIFWRTQMRDSLTWVAGKHTVKTGGEWVHSRNGQVFRGFFQGRYIFGSTDSFLHYAADPTNPAYGPWFYSQGLDQNGQVSDSAGYSNIKNEDFALFVQDKWQVTRNLTLNYGLRWEAQIMPDPVLDPSKTVYAPYIGDPRFPSNGKIPSQKKEFQPRVGLAWDITGKQKSVVRVSAGIYNGHQNMLSQVGSITTNGVTQQTVSTPPATFDPTVVPTPTTGGAGAPPGIRAFDQNYKNPRIYTGNFQFEQQVAAGTTVYLDLTWSKGVYLTNFIDYNRCPPAWQSATADPRCADAATRTPQFPLLGETMITSSRANSLYRGLTIGARRHLSSKLQFEFNYVYSEDWDDDSNERDPFTDLSVSAPYPSVVNMRANYAPSNRDMRHKFNAFLLGKLPFKIDGDVRLQAHTPQPQWLTDASGNPLPQRNSGYKDNAYTSVDWRVSRPFKFKERYELIPTIEMFNTFNSKNNVNTLSAPALFDFNGFLRKGVGDPRQAQLALKFKF
jgi:hypothetical protein